MQDDVTGFLDLETLTMYPPIFELPALSYAKSVVSPQELCFIQALERRLKGVSATKDKDDENDCITKLGLVQASSIRCAFEIEQ